MSDLPFASFALRKPPFRLRRCPVPGGSGSIRDVLMGLATSGNLFAVATAGRTLNRGISTREAPHPCVAEGYTRLSRAYPGVSATEESGTFFLASAKATSAGTRGCDAMVHSIVLYRGMLSKQNTCKRLK